MLPNLSYSHIYHFYDPFLISYSSIKYWKVLPDEGIQQNNKEGFNRHINHVLFCSKTAIQISERSLYFIIPLKFQNWRTEQHKNFENYRFINVSNI